MESALALRMDSSREGKSWSSSKGRKSSGMQWTDKRVLFGAGLKSSHGEFATRKALLSLVVRGVK